MVPLAPNTIEPVVYPESDGKPIADNTRQFDLIVLLKTNLDDRLPDFVAGDLFWYPVQGHPEIVVAPDVMVAFGRPKGERRSYKQWEEAGVAPQVAVEVLSPANTVREMMLKAAFYARATGSRNTTSSTRTTPGASPGSASPTGGCSRSRTSTTS
jgi:Uma2 family endonuclease